MFKNYFNDIAYIEVGPVIGLTIFFIFFVVLVYVVIKTDKGIKLDCGYRLDLVVAGRVIVELKACD